jgi:hypothetical protein
VGLPGGLKQAPPVQSGPDIGLPEGRAELNPIPPSEQVSSTDQAEFVDHGQAGKQNGHEHISPAATGTKQSLTWRHQR